MCRHDDRHQVLTSGRRIARSLRGTLVLLLLALAWPAPRLFGSGVDQGMARYVPWSGSYWPIREGALIQGPLTKYDQLTGSRAAHWEFQQNPPDPSAPEWFGYCHAWAAAAVLDREPIRPRAAQALDGRTVPLGIGDQKGMLTACHTDDVAQHFGVRFEGQPGEDDQDIYPDQLWRVLKLFVQQQGVPLIVDIEGGTQVWNYPVYAYRVDYAPTGQGHLHHAQLTLWMADDAVPPDMVGVQVNKQTYYFTFELREGAAQLGTGRWVEPSVRNHPDFAWYPYVVRAENPELDYQRIQQLVDASGHGPPLDGTPPAGANLPAAVGPPGIPLEPSPARPEPAIPGSTSPSSTSPSSTSPGRLSPPTVFVLPPNRVPQQPGASDTPERPGQPEPPGQPDPAGGPGGPVGPSIPRPGAWPDDRADTADCVLLSPVELLRLVTDRTSHFTLDVSVDKFDGGHYTVGEPLVVRGTCERTAYVYLFYLDNLGRLTLLFPRSGEANLVAADERFELPAAGTPRFRTSAAVGVHRIKAIATVVPLTFTGLVRPAAAHGVGMGERQPAALTSGFRLPPSQEAWCRQRIRAHLQGKQWPVKSMGDAAPQSIVGSFAQDEVAFYVGPAALPAPPPDGQVRDGRARGIAPARRDEP